MNIRSHHISPFPLPYGEEMATQKAPGDFSSRYKFNGKELDPETGLYYYGARYYHPAVSQWLSVDPLAEKYPSLSPYTYTYDNPVMFVDPTGMAGMKNDWIDNGDGTYTAEKGDSAATLARDAGISYEEANELVQLQHGPNRKGRDGKEYSNIQEGDIVVVPSKAVEKIEEKQKYKIKTEMFILFPPNYHNNLNKIESLKEEISSLENEAEYYLKQSLEESRVGSMDGGRHNIGYLLSVNILRIKTQNKLNKHLKKLDSLEKITKPDTYKYEIYYNPYDTINILNVLRKDNKFLD